WEKVQIPTSNIQRISKLQAPILRRGRGEKLRAIRGKKIRVSLRRLLPGASERRSGLARILIWRRCWRGIASRDIGARRRSVGGGQVGARRRRIRRQSKRRITRKRDGGG